jgi:xanthine dehydrogenase accessory factor
MREKGFGSDIVGRVHAPIGVSIRAETPQEIAISIVAGLIIVRSATQTQHDERG